MAKNAIFWLLVGSMGYLGVGIRYLWVGSGYFLVSFQFFCKNTDLGRLNGRLNGSSRADLLNVYTFGLMLANNVFLANLSSSKRPSSRLWSSKRGSFSRLNASKRLVVYL